MIGHVAQGFHVHIQLVLVCSCSNDIFWCFFLTVGSKENCVCSWNSMCEYISIDSIKYLPSFLYILEIFLNTFWDVNVPKWITQNWVPQQHSKYYLPNLLHLWSSLYWCDIFHLSFFTFHSSNQGWDPLKTLWKYKHQNPLSGVFFLQHVLVNITSSYIIKMIIKPSLETLILDCVMPLACCATSTTSKILVGTPIRTVCGWKQKSSYSKWLCIQMLTSIIKKHI